MFNIGPVELIVILLIALLIFGPKAIPQIGKAIGEGIREFKKSQSNKTQESKEEIKSTEKE